MKTVVLLLSLLALAATMAVAQAPPHSNYVQNSASQATASTQAAELRGCLSGTHGNYTLLDHSGKSHKVTGDSTRLWDETGHEVDLTGKVGAGGSFEETGITDIASRCWNFKLN